ncbi:MAG: hypothetical protein MPJ79_00960 [Alphaproteobacteria bacterium]|nr:hypothetical protein [Alphaproteobacteria bacterium]MDA7988530.1 hypothetical protein [Alphaproteobacteria bacterium]MDA8009106.1 hypothetical protein [Alphaproteobacteria bacterium]
MKVPKIDSDKQHAKWARLAFPLLVAQARKQEPMAYIHLSEKLNEHPEKPAPQAPPARALGDILGIIGDTIIATEKEWGADKIPPITALVGKKGKKGETIPSRGCSGFVAHFLGRPGVKSEDLATEEWEDLRKKIYNFPDWGKLLAHHGLVDNGGSESHEGEAESSEEKTDRRWGGEKESPEHKRLAEYVAMNPGIVGLPEGVAPGDYGENEKILRSNDKPDVFFQSGALSFAVEVKSRRSDGYESDLRRGIYQCVKYRAVLRAQQKADGKDENAEAVLVTEGEFPANLRRTADILGVEVFDSVKPK